MLSEVIIDNRIYLLIKMKKILFMLPVLAVCFASCEKDKENDGNSVQKLVKSITYMESPDYPLVTTFEYDENGRVICAKWTENGNTWTIADVAYEGNMIIETGAGGQQEVSTDATGTTITVSQLKEEYIHYLNDDGYVIKTEYKDYWSDESYNRTDAVTYEYDNGKLVKIAGNSIGDYPIEYKFQWQNNDIVAVSYNGSTENISYSNTVDNLNVDLSANWGYYGISCGIGSAATLKFKETTSEHLPQMLDEEVYSYELDSDGYVKTIKVDGEPIYYIEYVE